LAPLIEHLVSMDNRPPSAPLLGLLTTVLLFLLAPCLRAADNWTWESSIVKDDLWLASSFHGRKQFTFRIGAGGAISELRDVHEKDQPLLSPSFKGEATDRIIQWTAWSDSVTHPIPALPKFEWRFNVTQGGTFVGQLSPTTLVRKSPDGRTLDVYSVPQDQWKSEQQPHMRGKLAALTRYEMAGSGVLKIRRVLRVGDVTLDGNPMAGFEQFYLEAWTPFLRSPGAFDALALSIDPAGKPDLWYRAGQNLPAYPRLKVATTKGYGAVFNTGDPARHTAVALVYGVKQVHVVSDPPREDAANQYVLNSMEWDNGIAVLPALSLHDLKEGAIIDQTLYLIPRPAMDAEMAALLGELVKATPAPAVYPPGTHLTGELAEIATTLKASLSQPGHRTDHLATIPPPEDAAHEK
jgi:hypothetical protein